ncbi:hypothetical protein ACLF3G_28225 [Falsiroseomonas sp. HC035]|uniref:hypothetical protein n=1 Tax=Falsiroseomonas sp. HC035 TaxID=3390999 RepID=UPI003D310A03
MVLVVPARNAAEAEGWMIIHGFSARPQGVPGAYGHFVFADSNMERIIRSRGGVRENQEDWSFATPDGERLHLRLRYPPSPPTWGRIEALTFWPVFVGGHYRFDMSYQGLVLLRSMPIALDRISDVSFSATGPQMSVLFDGSERLVSVLSMPWQVRQGKVLEEPTVFEAVRSRQSP